MSSKYLKNNPHEIFKRRIAWRSRAHFVRNFGIYVHMLYCVKIFTENSTKFIAG